MTNEIIKGISKLLDDNFNVDNTSYDIYCDRIQQGLKNSSCFFIKLLNSLDKAVLNDRRYREYDFVIQFIPNDDGDNFNLNNIAETLFSCMKLIPITANNTTRYIHSFNMHYEIVDNILMFYTTFKFYTRDSDDNNDLVKMNVIEYDNFTINER